MDNYSDESYGERIADVYDQWYSEYDTNAIQVLSELAHGGKALELGIGTGRIALPLQSAGVTVHGIDASESMLARLQAKPGGRKIPVKLGNFAEFRLDDQFTLIYVVFNTFYALLTQEEQIRCFQNVARHLTSDGVFVIEAFVPDLKRFHGGQAMRTIRLGDHDAQIDLSLIGLDKQIITSQHMLISEKGTQFYPVKLRYVWPSEMDLMARISHLRLRERWCDWRKSPFTDDSGKHISIYEHSK